MDHNQVYKHMWLW